MRVQVAGVALDPAQQHIVLLKPANPCEAAGRVLPVWIGAQEATAILVAIQGVVPPRPLAHDLMVRMLGVLDGTVERVEVTRIEDGTFYAEITLTTPRGPRVIDARPSDAIALAARTHTDLWVADAVFAEAGVEDTLTEEPAEGAEPSEEAVDEFRRFLDDVDPRDFHG